MRWMFGHHSIHNVYLLFSVDPICEGIIIGFSLSLITGPILFALIQTSIEQGLRAGLGVGAGIWISDALFILCAFFGVSYIMEIATWEGFQITIGIAGTIILVTIGLGFLLTRPPMLDDLEKAGIRSSSYFSLWLKGFLINTINPFTFLFWLIVMPAMAAKFGDIPSGTGIFYWSIFITIVLTDALKVGLAKLIRRWLKPNFILWMRRVVGATLILFGIALIIRVLGDFDNNFIGML